MRVSQFARLLVVGLLTLLALAPSSAAFAASPTTETTSYDSSTTLTDWCAFPITFTVAGSLITTSFYDQNGNLVRQLLRTPNTSLTFSANGKTLTSKTPAPAIIDFTDNTLTVMGSESLFTAPGSGVVQAMVGRVVVDLSTGNVSFTGLQVFDQDAFCAALAP